jgi:group I intron endonuclease
MTGSIYGIYCGSFRIYIGATTNLPKRNQDHLARLKCNKHYSKKMQSDFNENGIEYYLFRILEEDIPLDKLSERENWWIRNYREVCYNQHNVPNLERNKYISRAKNVKNMKPVEELLDGIVVAEYPSIYSCLRIRGLTKGSFMNHLKGGAVKHVKGRIFRFKVVKNNLNS